MISRICGFYLMPERSSKSSQFSSEDFFLFLNKKQRTIFLRFYCLFCKIIKMHVQFLIFFFLNKYNIYKII